MNGNIEYTINNFDYSVINYSIEDGRDYSIKYEYKKEIDIKIDIDIDIELHSLNYEEIEYNDQIDQYNKIFEIFINDGCQNNKEISLTQLIYILCEIYEYINKNVTIFDNNIIINCIFSENKTRNLIRWLREGYEKRLNPLIYDFLQEQMKILTLINQNDKKELTLYYETYIEICLMTKMLELLIILYDYFKLQDDFIQIDRLLKRYEVGCIGTVSEIVTTTTVTSSSNSNSITITNDDILPLDISSNISFGASEDNNNNRYYNGIKISTWLSRRFHKFCLWIKQILYNII